MLFFPKHLKQIQNFVGRLLFELHLPLGVQLTNNFVVLWPRCRGGFGFEGLGPAIELLKSALRIQVCQGMSGFPLESYDLGFRDSFRPKNPTIFPGSRGSGFESGCFAKGWKPLFGSMESPEPKKSIDYSIDPGSDDCILGFGGTAQGIVYGFFYNNHGSGKWPFGD